MSAVADNRSQLLVREPLALLHAGTNAVMEGTAAILSTRYQVSRPDAEGAFTRLWCTVRRVTARVRNEDGRPGKCRHRTR